MVSSVFLAVALVASVASVLAFPQVGGLDVAPRATVIGRDVEQPVPRATVIGRKEDQFAARATVIGRDVDPRATVIGRGIEPHAPRATVIGRDAYQQHTSLHRRTDANKTFDIGFQALDEVLYSASWSASLNNIVIPGTPFSASASEKFSFSLECADCRTYGSVVADFDDTDGLDAMLTFNNVGAYVDLALVSNSMGTFTISLGDFLGDGQNITGTTFDASLGLGLELVMQLDAAVEMSGGFQISIPNGAALGLDINLTPSEAAGLDVSANLTTFPSVNFALLPIALNDTSVNVTVALILKANIGLTASVGPVTGSAGVGASLTLVEVMLGEVSKTNTTCLFANIDSNAGAYAEVGAALVNVTSVGVAPAVSTTFAAASTTTCLGAKATMPVGLNTTAVAVQTVVPAACPVALVTSTTTTTASYTLTSCLVSLINCPASLQQTIVATNIESITTTRCPVNGTMATPTAAVSLSKSSSTAKMTSSSKMGSSMSSAKMSSTMVKANATALSTSTPKAMSASTTVAAVTTVTVMAVPFPSAQAINIGSLASPVVASVPASLAAAMPAGNMSATVTGVFNSVVALAAETTAVPSSLASQTSLIGMGTSLAGQFQGLGATATSDLSSLAGQATSLAGQATSLAAALTKSGATAPRAALGQMLGSSAVAMLGVVAGMMVLL